MVVHQTALVHRPDVEGMRGLAIVLVVLAHAGVSGMAGGFIGVDVFFVISGFLITGLLLREWESCGRIDLWRFYARRMRRLMPAFVLAMIATAIMAGISLPAEQAASQLREGVWAALWISNVYFAFVQVDYFAAGIDQSLFLHTWSLGVEEQFYLVWPALMALACARSPGTTRLRPTLWAIVAAGIAIGMWGAVTFPVPAYYSMPTRLWQLALGGLTFVVSERSRAEGARDAMRALGWFGFAAVVGSAVLITPRTAYPGPWMLVPTLGTVALLAGGAIAPAQGAARLLGTRPFALLGRISYALYLWHWPLLLVANRTLPADWRGLAGAVAAALLLAWLSTSMVEQPIRARPIASARRGVLCGLLAATGLAGLLLLAASAAGRRAETERRDDRYVAQLRAALTRPIIYATDCDDWYRSATLKPCVATPGGAPRGTVVVIGDSVGLQWYPALETVALQADLKLVVLTKSACPMADLRFHYEQLKREYTECSEWRQAAMRYVASLQPDLVILGSSATYPFSVEDWVTGTRRLIEPLRAHTRRVVVLAPTPVLPFHGPDCVVAAMHEHDGTPWPDDCSVALELIQRADVTDALRTAVKGWSDVRVLDLNDLVCPRGVCSAWRDAMPIYRDDTHLNARFVSAQAPQLAHRLALPGPADLPGHEE